MNKSMLILMKIIVTEFSIKKEYKKEKKITNQSFLKNIVQKKSPCSSIDSPYKDHGYYTDNFPSAENKYFYGKKYHLIAFTPLNNAIYQWKESNINRLRSYIQELLEIEIISKNEISLLHLIHHDILDNSAEYYPLVLDKFHGI